MTHEEIKLAVQNSIQSGNWMIRTDNDGVSYNGFQWNPAGEWTEAPDWNPKPTCGFGLHGQTKHASGFSPPNKQRVLFCETEGPQIIIGWDKIKVRKARILLVNDLSLAEHLNFDRNLSLCGCTSLTHLPEHLTVGRYFDLCGCIGLIHLPEYLSVGGSLDLRKCTSLTHLPKHLTIKGNLYSEGCTGLPEHLI